MNELRSIYESISLNESTKKDIKDAFKEIGYDIKLKKVNMFGGQWYTILSGIDAIDKGNVYTTELFNKHKEFFALRNKYEKTKLDDGLSIHN